MHIEHVALWTPDPASLERLRTFYATYFGARAGERYESRRRPGFASYFLRFPDGGARLELMTVPGLGDAPPGEVRGYAHLAIALGSAAAVDALASRFAADGITVASGPRHTGDGYYEAVVHDPDGNVVEFTA